MSIIGELEESGFAVEWTLHDFFEIPAEVDKSYNSPSFRFAGASWNLEIYPNGQKEEYSEGYIDLFLFRASDGAPIDLNYSFGLKTCNDTITVVRHLTFNFKEKLQGYGYCKFLHRPILLKHLKSDLASPDHLTFVCRLKQIHSTTGDILTTKCVHCSETVDDGSLASHEKKCLNRPIKCPECLEVVALKDWHDHECHPAKEKGDSISSTFPLKDKILDDFQHLNPENCDVVLRVKGRKFQAHKAILAASSLVFASTFRNDIKQNATGEVDIDDCDPSTFSDFLRFLYTEGTTLRLSNENALNLFAVADKYGVWDLRTKCLEFIKEKVSQNAFSCTSVPGCSETDPIQLAVA